MMVQQLKDWTWSLRENHYWRWSAGSGAFPPLSMHLMHVHCQSCWGFAHYYLECSWILPLVLEVRYQWWGRSPAALQEGFYQVSTTWPMNVNIKFVSNPFPTTFRGKAPLQVSSSRTQERGWSETWRVIWDITDHSLSLRLHHLWNKGFYGLSNPPH